MSDKNLKLVLFLGFMIMGSITLSGAVSASAVNPSHIYVNTNGNDSWNGLSANYNSTTGNGPKKTIKKAVLAVKQEGTIYIAHGTYIEKGITINKDMKLVGSGQTKTEINGGNIGTIFNILNGVNFSIINLTVSNGNNKYGKGGAITNYGKLTLMNCTLEHNTGKYCAGAIYNWGSLYIYNSKFQYNTATGTSWGGGHGGAILNEGTLVMANSKLNNNFADDNGGAIYNDGTLTVTNSSFINNTAVSWGGGAICNYGKTTVTSSILMGNNAGYGGAIYNFNRTKVVYSQIINNTSNKGSAISSGAGLVNADDNWWGSNHNPSGMISGRVTYNPWLSTPIAVTNVDPANMTMNVAYNKVIKIVFNEPIEEGNKLIQLKDNTGNIIPLNISINGNILYLNPSILTNNTKYNLTLSNGSIKDLAGHSLQSYNTNFFTGTIPIITSINPFNGDLNVVFNKNITISFNEPIQNGSMWIELQNNSGTQTTFTTNIEGNILTITPSKMTKHTKYIILLHTGCIKDLSGHNLACDTFNFSTGPLPVVTSIKLISDKVIQLKFNVPIKTGSMSIQVLNSDGMAVASSNTIKDGYLNLKLHEYHYIDYINPHATPSYDLNAMKNSGITDVFMLVSSSPSASNYYKTYLPKIIPKFHAAGITLHAWIFPNFTAQDVARIAAMGVNVHLDLEFGYYPSTEYLTSYVSKIRTACAGRIFTVAVDPNAPGVDSGPINGEDYSLIAPYVDAIVPMLYKGDFDLSDSGMRSAAAYMQKQAPGKLWVALESYISDNDPVTKSSTTNLVEINDVKAYSNGLVSFRYGLSNFNQAIKTIISRQNRYTVIIHSDSITDLAGNPIKLTTLTA